MPLMTPASTTDPAWPALQLGKVVCALSLVVVHGVSFIATRHGVALFDAASVLDGCFQAGAVLALPNLLVPFTAGCVLSFRCRRRPPSALAVIADAAALIAIGIVLYGLFFGWQVWSYWNVLGFLGLSFMIVALVDRFLGRSGLVLSALAVLVVADPLRAAFGHSEQPYWVYVLIGDWQGRHTWPLLPWLATVIAGYLIAESYRELGASAGFVRLWAGAGAAATALGVSFGHILPIASRTEFFDRRILQPTAVTVLGLVGVGWLALAVLTRIVPAGQWPRHGIVDCFSRGILWVYLGQMVLGLKASQWIQQQLGVSGAIAVLSADSGALVVAGFVIVLLLASWGVARLALVVGDRRVVIELRRARSVQ